MCLWILLPAIILLPSTDESTSMPEPKTFEIQRVDHFVIWIKHIPDEVYRRKLKSIEAGQVIKIYINGHLTTWQRMRPDRGGRPTDGFKIVQGRDFWETIPMRGSFVLSFSPPGERPKPAQPPTPVALPSATFGGARRLFARYMFADYSGASSSVEQRRNIKLAYSAVGQEIVQFGGPLNRETLLREMLRQLREATQLGERTIFGIDHQYSIPLQFARELGLASDWRKALQQLVEGNRELPRLTLAGDYCAQINRFLMARGRAAYFWSATKTKDYSGPPEGATEMPIVPGEDPRSGDRHTTLRKTERLWRENGQPKPFNRVGDKGTVGGQTILGLAKLYDLLTSARDTLPIAVWPFDGLDLAGDAYADKHVMIEVYLPTMRLATPPQADWNDAMSCVATVRDADAAGTLSERLGFGPVCAACEREVRFEGWIAWNRCRNPSMGKTQQCSLCERGVRQ